jgi:hypothetical protein
MTRFNRTIGYGIGALALVALVGCAHGTTELGKHWGESFEANTTAMTEGAQGSEEPDLDPITSEGVMGRYGASQSDTQQQGPRPTIINVGPN